MIAAASQARCGLLRSATGLGGGGGGPGVGGGGGGLGGGGGGLGAGGGGQIRGVSGDDLRRAWRGGGDRARGAVVEDEL